MRKIASMCMPIRRSAAQPDMSRRRLSATLLLGTAGGVLGGIAAPAFGSRDTQLAFDELYGRFGVLGLEYSKKVQALNGHIVTMRGFMAPPLKAEAMFFVLTRAPMALCPFCSSDADWPDDIVVIYLARKQTFVQPSAMIEVRGRLETGSWRDPDTGFLSLLRLRDARYDMV